MELRDSLLKETVAMPAAASTSVETDPIDTLHGDRGQFVANCEFVLTAPALTSTMLPDGKTMTYKIEQADDEDFSENDEDLFAELLVQTGADSTGGAATDTVRFRLPSDVRRYIRAVATSGEGTATAAAVEMTLEAVF